MSLTSLNTASTANAGVVMPVLHPTDRVPLFYGEGDNRKPVTITLLGRDSEQFIRAERASRKQVREALVRRQPYSPADEDRAADQALAACTVAWDGIPAGWLDGSTDETPVEHSAASALKLYGNSGVRWLRDQVDEFIGERANFLKVSPTN